MWQDETGTEYSEQAMHNFLVELGMLYPAVVMAQRRIIEYRGYTFRDVSEANANKTA